MEGFHSNGRILHKAEYEGHFFSFVNFLSFYVIFRFLGFSVLFHYFNCF
jgi:hypothetical protein